jgi:hypothetical protein
MSKQLDAGLDVRSMVQDTFQEIDERPQPFGGYNGRNCHGRIL